MAALVTIPAVPIARVGVWQTSTGEWDCTAEQLASAVAAEASGLFRTPIMHIGHDQMFGDGQPAVGRLERMRVTDAGQTLVADLVGVPAWLAEIAATAYPSRSIECYLGVPTDGQTWPMVVTGLALLGVTPPAIESLGDLADLFGVSRDVEHYLAASRRVAASALPQEDLMPRALGQVVASANMDELRSAAETWAATQPDIGRDAYVRDLYTDTVILTSWAYDEPTFWRAAWTEAGGAFTFGAPEKVRPTYEPVPVAAGQEVAASVLLASPMTRVTSQPGQRVHTHQSSEAVPSPRGRAVEAAQPTEENVPISPALAELLGVDLDADEQAVEAAARALREKADAETPAPTELEGGTTTTAPTPADLEDRIAAAVAKATAPILASLTTTSGELAEIKAKDAKSTKDGVIGDAVRAGKIRPADRESWETRYDAAPGVIAEVLASLAPGTAVPVSASGHTGGEVTDGGLFSDADYARAFPDDVKAGA